MAFAASFLLQRLLAKVTPESENNDPRIYLEDVTDPDNLAWVRAQNKAACAALGEPGPGNAMYDRFLTILDSKAKIPYISKINNQYYNFWQDADHVRGVWRRTTMEEYGKGDECAWETVLDLDALAAAEGENWVWKSRVLLDEGPNTERDLCLIKLSRGGADAVVLREFSLKTKSFVTDRPFNEAPEAKTSVCYVDKDTLLIGTDLGAGSLTASGYPRVVKQWRRGTPLASAKTIFEGSVDDVWVHGQHYYDHGIVYDALHRGLTFYTAKEYIRIDGEYKEVPIPEDCRLSTFRDQFLFHLRSEWTINGTAYPGGSLLAAPVAAFMAGDSTGVVALFTPTATMSLDGFTATLNYVVLEVLDNVQSKLLFREFTAATGQWVFPDRALQLENLATVGASAVDADTTDDLWLTSTGFTSPTTLSLASAADDDHDVPPLKLRALPAYFRAKGLAVTQHWATSLDGTRVPYFQVARADMPLDGSTPTLLYGYGGFEISMLPYYSATLGAGWLEHGHCYVQANIRGGGEFGPAWHQAALKDKRHKAYEDFIAVAEDLVRRGVTQPARLGIQGGSNGGLLVGNMYTWRPELWGAVLCQVPLLDMRRFSQLLAGASWVGEYGDPDKPAEWAFLKRYSPYHNIPTQRARVAQMPPLLVTTSTRDDRVHPGHARKFVRCLQDRGHARTLYYENIEGGHGGAADNKQRAFMSALGYSFLLKTLALPKAA